MSIFPKSLVPDDFVIIVRPVKDDEELNINGGHWTGEVQVSIVTNAKETTLTEDEFNNMIMLCNFAAASIPAMEENEFVRDIIENYVSIEAIEAALTEEEFKGYIKGNVLKYTWRENYKNKMEDLEKAAWYLNRLLKSRE